MRGCGDCCRSLLLSLFGKNLILVWLVSSVLGSPSLRQAQANSLRSQAVWNSWQCVVESLFPVSLVHCPLLLVSLMCPASIQLVCITWLRSCFCPGAPVFIAGECADVKATVAALKATVAEDMC